MTPKVHESRPALLVEAVRRDAVRATFHDGFDSMLIRPYSDLDLAAYLLLRQALWPEPSLEGHRTELAELLAAAGTAILVSVDADGCLNGFVELSLRANAESCASSPVGYVEGWFVVPESRGRGVGRALLKAGEAWARSQGCSEMASDAELANVNSQLAHESCGYREVARIVCYRKPLE